MPLSLVMIVKQKIIVAIRITCLVTNPNMKSTTIMFIKRFDYSDSFVNYQFN